MQFDRCTGMCASCSQNLCLQNFCFIETAQDQWFKKDENFDVKLDELFKIDFLKAVNNEYDEWQDNPEECVALVLLLDQLSRNFYRNNSKAFEQDYKCRLIVNEAIDRGYLEELDKEALQVYAGLGWEADYPDPQDFLDILFHSQSAQNHGQHSNSQLDDILERARVEQDINSRIELYRQAEQILANANQRSQFPNHTFEKSLGYWKQHQENLQKALPFHSHFSNSKNHLPFSIFCHLEQYDLLSL